jgi:hypothetical protein
MSEKKIMFGVEKGLVALDSLTHVLPGTVSIAQRRFGDWFVTDHNATLPDGLRIADALGAAVRVSSKYTPALLEHVEIVPLCDVVFTAPAANHVVLLPHHPGEQPVPAPEGSILLTEPVHASRDPKQKQDSGLAWLYYGPEPFTVGTTASNPVHRED